MNLSVRPNPTELTTSISVEFTGRGANVETQRNLFCGQYDDCLDQAVRRGWSSFSCSKCPCFVPAEATKRNKAGIDMYATQRRIA